MVTNRPSERVARYTTLTVVASHLKRGSMNDSFGKDLRADLFIFRSAISRVRVIASHAPTGKYWGC